MLATSLTMRQKLCYVEIRLWQSPRPLKYCLGDICLPFLGAFIRDLNMFGYYQYEG